jgi:hypothetical protein
VDVSVKVTFRGTCPDVGFPVKSALLLKVAVTALAESMVTVHGLVLEMQSNVNPIKLDPESAEPVRLTAVPET